MRNTTNLMMEYFNRSNATVKNKEASDEDYANFVRAYIEAGGKICISRTRVHSSEPIELAARTSTEPKNGRFILFTDIKPPLISAHKDKFLSLSSPLDYAAPPYIPEAVLPELIARYRTDPTPFFNDDLRFYLLTLRAFDLNFSAPVAESLHQHLINNRTYAQLKQALVKTDFELASRECRLNEIIATQRLYSRTKNSEHNSHEALDDIPKTLLAVRPLLETTIQEYETLYNQCLSWSLKTRSGKAQKPSRHRNKLSAFEMRNIETRIRAERQRKFRKDVWKI